MIQFIRESLANQYGAALAFLQDCIQRCEQGNWHKPVGQFAFWNVAYHTAQA